MQQWPSFASLDELVKFFDTRDMGEYEEDLRKLILMLISGERPTWLQSMKRQTHRPRLSEPELHPLNPHACLNQDEATAVLMRSLGVFKSTYAVTATTHQTHLRPFGFMRLPVTRSDLINTAALAR